MAGEFDPAPLPEASFLVPDIPSAPPVPGAAPKFFTFKVGLVVIADYSAFGQDPESVSQVGRQRDQWDDRAARLMFRGNLGKVNYLLAGEYKGFETDPEDLWQLTDVSLTFPVGSPSTRSRSARRRRRSRTRWSAMPRTCRRRSACSTRSSSRGTSG